MHLGQRSNGQNSAMGFRRTCLSGNDGALGIRYSEDERNLHMKHYIHQASADAERPDFPTRECWEPTHFQKKELGLGFRVHLIFVSPNLVTFSNFHGGQVRIELQKFISPNAG